MSEEAHDHHGAVHSDAHYIKIWGVLLVLLIISIAGPEVAGNFEPSTATWIVLITAFGIAFYKAYLVIKHFMHLTVEKPIVGYILITCLVFMVLFFAGVSPDVMKHTGSGWVNKSAKEEIKRAEAEAAAAAEHGDGHGGGHGEVEAVVEEEPEPAKPAAPTFADMTTDEQKKAFLMQKGEDVYGNGGENAPGAACVSCHRSSGAGHGPNFPPLKGAGVEQWVGDCATHARIVLKGMEGEMVVGETTYNYPMPGFDGLTDLEVAAVTTYVGNSWGNAYGVCTPSDVSGVR